MFLVRVTSRATAYIRMSRNNSDVLISSYSSSYYAIVKYHVVLNSSGRGTGDVDYN